MPTANNLREKVLARLGVTGEGLQSSAYDQGRMDDLITYEFAWLEGRGLNYWTATAIPDAVMGPLIEFIAGMTAKEFAVSRDAPQFEREREGAYRRLVDAVAVKNHGEPLSNEYF